jgi:hypothetical protein
MNLECDNTNTEGMLVHPDTRATSDTTLTGQTVSEATTQTQITQLEPASPKQTKPPLTEPPKLVRKPKPKSKKKKKSGYQDLMSSMMAPQQTEIEKQQNHLDRVSAGTGHGTFSKLERI